MLSVAAMAAGLDFPETQKEIKAPSDAQTVTADFKFTNTSGKTQTITKYDAACSCMAVQISGGKLKYAPGESGVVRAKFELGNFSGTVDKVVALWLDGDKPESPSLQLNVRVHIPVLVEMEPKTLTWDLNGKGEGQTIEIRMTDENPIEVLRVSSASEEFTHELTEVKKGKHYRLQIKPLNVERPGLAVFRIETSSEIPRHRNQQAFAVVRKSAVVK